jgi:hypothetical protein
MIAGRGAQNNKYMGVLVNDDPMMIAKKKPVKRRAVFRGLPRRTIKRAPKRQSKT